MEKNSTQNTNSGKTKINKAKGLPSRRYFFKNILNTVPIFCIPRFLHFASPLNRLQNEPVGGIKKQITGLNIIENGKSKYKIILNPGASPSEKYAAAELKKYLKLCNNVEMPVLNETGNYGPQSHLIVLGCGNISKGFGVNPSVADLEEQGFLLKTSGTNLVIAGTREVGTLYGVSHFLENYFGVRWYTPEEIKLPNVQELKIPTVEQLVKPTFLYRNIYYKWPGENDEFFTRLRLNAATRDESDKYGLGYVSEATSSAHSYFNYVNPKEYFEKHPEYFSEIGGKRIKEDTQLCLTNPEVFEIVLKGILDKMRKRPELKHYNFAQHDRYNFCQCEKCRAMNKKYGTKGATQFWFVNKLAERTSKEFPDKYISTLAYMYTEKPPEGMQMHSNVAVWLCHFFPCCNVHPITECKHNARHELYAKKWSSICNHLYIWYYIVDFSHYYNPFPNFRAMSADMKFYKKIGVEGIFAQGMGQRGGGGEFNLLRGYYCSKLLWDAEQDDEIILKDFLEGYYGEAWEALWKYTSLLHDEVEQNNIHLHLYDNPGYLNDKLINRAEELFDIAEKKVAADKVLLERVKTARMAVKYAKLFPRNGYRIESGMLLFYEKIGNLSDAKKFVERMKMNGYCLISENSGVGDPERLLGMAKMYETGLPVITLSNNVLSADIVPVLSGRVLRIVHKKTNRCVTAYNKVRHLYFPWAGGQENRVGEFYEPCGWIEPAEVIGQTKDSVTTRAQLFNGLILERKVSLAGEDGGMTVLSSLINPGEKPREDRLRSHLELDLGSLDTVKISFTGKDGQEKSPDIKEIIGGMIEGRHYYRGEAPQDRWSFSNNGLRVEQSFSSAYIESGWLYTYPEKLGELNVELWLPRRVIAPGGKITFEEKIEVYHEV